MTAEEIRALGDVAGEAISGGAARVEELHTAIADRSFGPTGPASRPARKLHDAIAGSVYGAVRIGTRTAARAGAAALAVAHDPAAPSMTDTPRGRAAVAALNGAFGDRLADRRSPLALDMEIRVGREAVAAEPAALAAAFPDAGRRVAVFLHGLGEHEGSWRGAEGFPRRLREDLGITPVLLRCNTGLHISENGRRLSALLDAIVRGWPVADPELVLIGHSMGGLMIRSAIHAGTEPDAPWTARVSDVCCLGTPHDGAPLELLAHRAFWALGRLPEGRPAKKIADLRSAGVKDLRYGALTDEHHADDLSGALGEDTVSDVAMLPHARLHCCSATLAQDPDSRYGRLVGDLLVLDASAHGRGPTKHRRPLELHSERHFGGLSHFDLLHHPDVYDLLRGWLTPAPVALLAR